jgi:hypothetical protein
MKRYGSLIIVVVLQLDVSNHINGAVSGSDPLAIETAAECLRGFA